MVVFLGFCRVCLRVFFIESGELGIGSYVSERWYVRRSYRLYRFFGYRVGLYRFLDWIFG